MISPSRAGLTIAVTHTIILAVTFMLEINGIDEMSAYGWLALAIADLPASFLLTFDTPSIATQLHPGIYTVIMLGVVGGLWWFSIGWITTTVVGRFFGRKTSGVPT